MTSVAAINSLGGYAHNPRGNLWFKDESTYGHKLLQKMGWNKGKGLGKNEDGIKEGLKVKFKNSYSGLGFKDDAYTNVMKTEYESILQDLSAEYSHEGTTNLKKEISKVVEEPVQKSRVVKSKLRYPKLFFGKDVTKYTEQDMKSIFICSTPVRKDEVKVENSINTEEFEIEPPKMFDTCSSTFTISDYFDKKMKEKKSNALNKDSANPGTHQQTCLEYENSKNGILTVDESTLSKRKKKDLDLNIDLESADFTNPHQNISQFAENRALSKKKSSKKRKKSSEITVNGTETNSLHGNDNSTKKQNLLNVSECANSISDANNITEMGKNVSDYSCRPSKKRKMTQVCENRNNYIESYHNCFENKSPYEPELTLTSKQMKKKNKKHSTTIQLLSQNSISENSHKLVKKSDEENGYLFSDTLENELLTNKDYSKKKNKSKRKLKDRLKSCLKSKSSSYSLKNVSFNEIVSFRIINSDFKCMDSLADDQKFIEDIVSNGEIDCNQGNSDDNTHSVKQDASDEVNIDDSSFTKKQSKINEIDQEYTLADLPSSKSSHFNCWIESQRQALKMDIYKKLLKNMKNDKILKTTNLLSIKGYGNWGFK